jgi:polyisoprenoid-binding protein YceI
VVIRHCGAASAATAVQIPRAGRFDVDPQGSTVAFTARHLFGLARVQGTIAVRRGGIDVADPVGHSGVHVELDAASFHTGNRRRDRDVRSARFLDTDRYPTVTFRSTRLEAAGDAPRLLGTLTVRDVTRPVSLLIQQCTVRPDAPGSVLVRASTRLDRTDLGLTAARGLAGRYLEVSLMILAVRR